MGRGFVIPTKTSTSGDDGSQPVRLGQGAHGLLRRSILEVDKALYHKFVAPAVAFLPARLAYGVAILQADILWRLQDDLRRELEFRIRLILGDQMTAKERERVVRDYFKVYPCERIDQIRLLGNGRALLGMVEVQGQEHLTRALSRNKGMLLCSAHFGSSTCCFSVVGAMGIPVTLIARWSYPDDRDESAVRRFVNRMGDNVPFTSHLKGPNIMRKPGRIAVAFQAALLLRENEVVGTMLDAALKPRDTSKAVEVIFMGRKVILVPGAVSIAQLTGAPVLIVLLRRTSDWRHQVLEIFPPILIDGDTIGSFQRCLAVVEAAIRRHPEQWVMWNSPELIRMELLPKTDSARVRKWMPQLRR